MYACCIYVIFTPPQLHLPTTSLSKFAALLMDSILNQFNVSHVDMGLGMATEDWLTYQRAHP